MESLEEKVGSGMESGVKDESRVWYGDSKEVLRCANITKRNYKIKKLKKRGYFVVHFCYIKV